MRTYAKLCAAALCVLLPLGTATAASSAFAINDINENVQRIQIRLTDLGYLYDAVPGRMDSACYTAFVVARREAQLTISNADQLFSSSAVFSAEDVASAASFHPGGMILRGRSDTWDTVRPLLTENGTYFITSCTSGVVIHMNYIGGTGHAEMVPTSSWEEATLRTLFGDFGDHSTLPVTITINNTRILASLQATPHACDETSGISTYCLYFLESTANVGGLTDIAHADTLNQAIVG